MAPLPGTAHLPGAATAAGAGSVDGADRIAISYRRADTEAVTGRLFDRLSAHYGRDAVFRDIDSIAAGRDFRVQVEHALRGSGVFLAIVGRLWRGSGRGGVARLDDEADPVRVEIEIALRHGIPIIPVLVGTVRMPAPSQLPASLRPFCFLHACRIDPGQDFDHHTDRLIGQIDRLLHAGQPQPPVPPVPAPPPAPPPLVPAASTSMVRHYGVSFGQGAASAGAETAPAEWGGYARGSVAHYPGTYLVVRPAFKTAGNLYAYLADIAWDEEAGGLIFQERERPDARYSQHGRIWIPNPSVHLYMVSGKDGWLRAVTLSFLAADETMSGIISTLHNVGGGSFMPVAAPIVLMKRETLEGDVLGEITPDQPQHATYTQMLRRATASGAARLIGV